MSAGLRIVAVTDADALARAEAVHRELRTQLEADYRAQMQRLFERGARMCAAERDGAIVGVAVYRILENTFDGLHLYVDDLVTAEHARSSGVGRALIDHLEALARMAACKALTLDSGTERHRAHAFYLREGLQIRSFHFVKRLD